MAHPEWATLGTVGQPGSCLDKGLAIERVGDSHSLLRLHPLAVHCRQAGHAQHCLGKGTHTKGCSLGRSQRSRPPLPPDGNPPRLLACAGLLPDIAAGLNLDQLATPPAQPSCMAQRLTTHRAARQHCAALAAMIYVMASTVATWQSQGSAGRVLGVKLESTERRVEGL